MKKNRLRAKALTEEVKIYLNKYIKSLDLKKSNKLPSEEVLADLIGVSRITIRGALNEMASEGTIFRRQGKGTFVNIEALEMKVRFNPVMEFREMILNSGYRPSVKLMEMAALEADEYLSEKLDIDLGENVVVAKKVFYADENPCAYCIDYIPKAIIGSEDDTEYLKYEDSIFEYIYKKTGKSVTWDRVEILTQTNLENSELGEVFDVGSAVKSFLSLRGINFDNDDIPLVYAEEYIDTNFIKFNMIRQRQISY
jgi:GntR family transcriptional regulator